MRGAEERRTLLGRLAGHGWFIKHGEVAATTGLAFLLEEEPLRVAFLSHLNAQTGIDVSGVTHFVPEAVHGEGDLARPDLEGRNDALRPLVKIEAKLTAGLTREQLEPYMRHQKRELAPQGLAGAFVVLIPSHRKPKTQSLVDSMHPVFREPPALGTYVMTWDELFDVLDEAALTASDKSAAITADLFQLRDLCKTLHGLDITPLGDAASGPGWKHRQTDLERIVERVTERLSGDRGLLPTGKDSLYEFRRYINNSGPDSFSSIGLVSEFANEGCSPLWLRYRSPSPRFYEISARLRSSSLRDRARHEQGHIWLPLTVPADDSGEDIVDDIVKQVTVITGELSDA